ncbi:hypothetical protein GGH94_002579 [Coemansia aciculifera]|uniref:Uncharacterized protein n=1 Tax=Coemansia aciculifera TaxID=417176 RepID=A0A9W8IIS5_9FUNG|nr:hypothetical protein GGH94_002579 [Coemansia aciculifera]
MYAEQDSDYLSLSSSDDERGEINDLVTKASLDIIMREVSTTGSTWADLREQYSPKQSAFEPLSFNASTWAAFAKAGITGLNSDLAVDEAYSQAVTMTAYGVELLRVALSCPHIHRRQIIQVGNMLTTLCASLSDTRDWHRVALSEMLVDKADSYRRSQCVGEKMDPDGVHFIECIGDPKSSEARRRESRVGETVVRERSYMYPHESLCPEVSQQQQTSQQLRGHDTEHINPVVAREVGSTPSTPFPTQLPCIGNGRESGQRVEDATLAAFPSIVSDTVSSPRESVGGTDSPSATDSTVAVAVIPRASRPEVLPMDLSRQRIIRDSLLRQGFSELAITAYVDQFTKLSASDAQAKDKTHGRQSVRNGKRESAKALVAAHKSNVDLSGTLAKRFNAAIELLHDHGLITLSAVAPRIPLPQCAKTFSRSLPPAVAARRLRVKVAIRESIRTRQAARDRQHTINIRAALCRLAKAKDNSPAVAEMAAQAMELDQEFQVVSARVLEYERQAAQAKQAIRDTRATRSYDNSLSNENAVLGCSAEQDLNLQADRDIVDITTTGFSDVDSISDHLSDNVDVWEADEEEDEDAAVVPVPSQAIDIPGVKKEEEQQSAQKLERRVSFNLRENMTMQFPSNATIGKIAQACSKRRASLIESCSTGGKSYEELAQIADRKAQAMLPRGASSELFRVDDGFAMTALYVKRGHIRLLDHGCHSGSVVEDSVARSQPVKGVLKPFTLLPANNGLLVAAACSTRSKRHGNASDGDVPLPASDAATITTNITLGVAAAAATATGNASRKQGKSGKKRKSRSKSGAGSGAGVDLPSALPLPASVVSQV